ncbi:Enoyl-CoA hydratase/carnithine racemase [Asanoa ishikariensis]|uniref:Enoyl-CoA hydratase/carnithine racemase n=1 Tax=Asanoa ishikariensis TaxID=137265 RepID=A0A1H3TRJ6_9ACTN|nr:enoyl-CoA hydratase/isomerase family protein [Asanoa ishikariensis]SDZ52627.1 Enoyl-CoA hydratase/carnithine racemase [Asanoa ishikariensis]
MPQIHVREHSLAYWRATFDNGPVNLMDPETIYELDALVTRLETDPDVKVVVFDSANPDYFIAHWDLAADPATVAGMATESSTRRGVHPYTDVFTRISRLPVVTVASVRGRVRGAGSEFILACDIRFASRERAVLGQFEVGLGAVPGGGTTAWLPRLMGRGRALEVLLGADDFPGDLAERYGYVNRALPDAELNDFVDRFARRIAGFEKEAIVGTKNLVNRVDLPSDDEFVAALNGFFESVARPSVQARAAALFALGLQRPGDGELWLGDHVAAYSES